MKALLDKFRALTEREQQLVILSGVFIVVAIFYWGIWSPLTTSIEQQRQLLDNQQSLLTWVNDSAARPATSSQHHGEQQLFRQSAAGSKPHDKSAQYRDFPHAAAG